ncbi:MAG: alkylhydroperoxidase [Moraxellaceae bacterium]|nr:MAG: alkylhydroperoxidase [Moraxellaceae bacterium]
MTSQYVFNQLQPVSLASADEQQAAILSQAKKQVGFIPNMYSNMVNLPAFLDTYLHGYGLFREQSDLTSAEQEVVLLAISKANSCHYCMAAHSTLAANFSGVPADTLAAIRSGEEIADGKIAALYAMAIEVNDSRGRPDPVVVKAFLQAGYSEKHLLAIILAVSVKVLSNYSNHLFNTEVDEAFAAYAV